MWASSFLKRKQLWEMITKISRKNNSTILKYINQNSIKFTNEKDVANIFVQNSSYKNLDEIPKNLRKRRKF